tara:strand:+ start:1331 stop:1930 length:600 start_codon:yes stop_codon:yes gene_type:complete
MQIKNIINIYNLATPDEIKHGVTWYKKAYLESKKLALKYDIPIHIVIGVIASLSPNNKWDRNVENADTMINAFINGNAIESFKVSTYNKMKEKAWLILETMPSYEETITILNGKKIVSFYKNINGDETEITIDGHARNIFYNDRQGLTTPKTNITKLEYAKIQKAYLKASKKIKVNDSVLKAYELQAITWLAWKRIHDI